MDEQINGNGVKKQEDSPESMNDSKGDKRDSKQIVVKTLNRVPRACNACRKQKMRCEGADNPPCRRCRNGGLECLFEKPSREATLTGEAGLERIRSLENHVSEIRHTQASIQATLQEIAFHLRTGHTRSPSTYSAMPFQQQSPSMQSISSPPMSASLGGQFTTEPSHNGQPSSAGSGPTPFTPHGPVNPMMSPTGTRQSQSRDPASYGNYNTAASGYTTANTQPTTLPPFSSIGAIAAHQSNSSSRHHAGHNGHPHRPYSKHNADGSNFSNTKRPAGSPNAGSAESTDWEGEEEYLPARGLVAPWEVLRGLADVAVEQASQEIGDSSEPVSRARTPERQSRPTKRRKMRHKIPQPMTSPDVVTKGIITEAQARELFRIFYHGCSTFLPVFDAKTDTYDVLHERSPFAVDCICMVAARVRDGGNPSEIYHKCLEEAQTISCATLFWPVTRPEAVQAMILVSGWSDNGWLSGGHAVRMAMELSMHKAWPKLLKRMSKRREGDPITEEDRQLAVASRTWFCLYLFEHQMSYGTGRPAVLKDDESIWNCRMLLQHPLAIEDDMRLVSTVELMAIRERITNKLGPYDQPVDDHTFEVLREADRDFQTWYNTWDVVFSHKYEDAAFYRQSLQVQHYHAELFHNATALRGINGPEDVRKMPDAQKQLALRSIVIARKGLDVTINSPAYREGMKYAVHYTHATATFAASFLLRLAQLFPNDCDQLEIRSHVEHLVGLMLDIPGKRYAVTLQLMLKRNKKRTSSQSRSPHSAREQPPSRLSTVIEPSQPSSMSVSSNHNHNHAHGHSRHPHLEPFTPAAYEQQAYPSPDTSQGMPIAPATAVQSMMNPHHHHQQHQHHHSHGDMINVDNIWRGFEMTSHDQLPVWLSDQSLGGNTFSQQGMDAFLLPSDYLPTPQIW